jgi:hypothetical protein
VAALGHHAVSDDSTLQVTEGKVSGTWGKEYRYSLVGKELSIHGIV